MTSSKIMSKFARETCLHGVPKVIVSRSATRRYIWACICFVSGLMCIIQVAEVLRRFSMYQKHTNVDLVADEPVPFPAVSVCHTRNLDFHVLNTINRLFNENEFAETHVNFTGNLFVREYMKMLAKYSPLWFKYQDELDYRTVFQEVFSRTTFSANIPEDVISSAAIQLDEFFVTCFFGGNKCNLSKDFSTFFDSYYYNCFTYTEPDNKQSPESGINSGFSAIVLIGNGLLDWQNNIQILPGLHDAYSPVAASEGVRVVIHPPGTQPFPFAEGYDVPPGYSASFGVRPRRNIRIGQPHGNCNHVNPFDIGDTTSNITNTSSDNKTSNIDTGNGTDSFISSDNTRTTRLNHYRRISCQKMCLQSHVVAECQCYDTSLPILPAFRRQQKRSTDYGTPDEQEGRTWVKPCRLNDEFADSCKDNATDDCLDALMTVYKRIKCARQTRDAVTRNTTLMEQCGCHPPCDEFQYDVSYSMSKWPATGFEGDSAYYDIFYVENFRERFKKLNKSVSQHFSDVNRRDTMKDFTRLNVYISGDEGGVFVTRESAEFSVNRLISEIGGQLAIWVGVSAIAIAEIVELGVVMVRYLATSKRKDNYDLSSSMSIKDSAMCSASSTLQNLSQTN